MTAWLRDVEKGGAQKDIWAMHKQPRIIICRADQRAAGDKNT